MEMLEALLDFLFPPRCPACKAYVERRGMWCDSCLKAAARPFCLPLFGFYSSYSLGAYNSVLSRMIKDLKYRKKKSVLPYLTYFIERAGYMPPEDIDFAVPVPLHVDKERQRGFNQAEEIFRPWLAAHGVPLRRVLQRKYATKPMYGLKRRERAENLRDAFSLTGGVCIQGKNILLIDDIFTTGATARACRRVLETAGAGRVALLVLASNADKYTL